MKTKTTKRILAALVTIPIAISLTGCGGTNDKKSEPKKPAVTSSQSVKDEKAAKEKAQAEAKAKAEADAKAQAQATPAPQKPAVKQAQKPAVQQTRKAAPSRSVAKKPARQYRAPANPAPKKPAKTNSGYKPKPYEKEFGKNDVGSDGTITGGGDEDGNVWHGW
ncbi:MAG: hypothetical protein KIA12_09210 [Varibaculum cambriense]|uniref:hypothetical protein n=1 Tax=Varibaculum cambriense TaxID=184870 RepID=UPI00241CB416|nr:hypothetical protein [Varibaculum cambriense]MBS5973650.1 hypothetical protein [Varibaculum cambriense]